MSLRRHELNTLKLQKGTIDGNRFPIFDSVKDCDVNNCVLSEECPFEKEERKNGTPIKCKVQANFMRTMMDIVLDNLPDKAPTEYTLQKIGLQLMPLFKQLISLQMLETSLADIVIGDGDKVKIHPVYKEIRIVTKDIDKCLKHMNIHTNVLDVGSGVDASKQLETGTRGYYEEMQNEHEEESKKHNKKKKKI